LWRTPEFDVETAIASVTGSKGPSAETSAVNASILIGRTRRQLPDRQRASRRIGRQLLVFGAIGIASTAAYGVLYLALRTPLGSVAANALALVLTAIANTAANRQLTFGVRDRASMVRDQLGGLVALAVALAITTATANLLAAFAPNAGRLVELAALTAANAVSTVARFVLLRSWIAGRAQGVAP
jgi:putative flippase GtrA